MTRILAAAHAHRHAIALLAGLHAALVAAFVPFLVVAGGSLRDLATTVVETGVVVGGFAVAYAWDQVFPYGFDRSRLHLRRR